jgi:hypothetical protein
MSAPPNEHDGPPVGEPEGSQKNGRENRTKPKPKPNRVVWVRAYEVFHVAREHRLSGTDRGVFWALVLGADWRTHDWRGTLVDLRNDSGHSTNTLTGSVKRIAETGLIEVVEPFSRNGQGLVHITAYAEVVVVQQPQNSASARQQPQNSANDDAPTRAEQGTDMKPTSDEQTQSCANPPALTSENAEPQGIEATRDEGTHGVLDGISQASTIVSLKQHFAATEVVGETCQTCGLMTGHPRGRSDDVRLWCAC